MTRKKDSGKLTRKAGIQAGISKMLQSLASNGVIVLQNLQSSWNTLVAAGASEQDRFVAALEATGIKICPGCADWLRTKWQWQLDVHLVKAP